MLVQDHLKSNSNVVLLMNLRALPFFLIEEERKKKKQHRQCIYHHPTFVLVAGSVVE